MKPWSALACLLVACALPAACLDLQPIPYDERPAPTPDASVADAARDVDVDAAVEACRECLATGPCRSQQTACAMDAECSVFSACMTAKSCWSSSVTNLMQLTPCMLTCAAQAGIAGQSDPAVALLTPVFTCAQTASQCGNVCAPGVAK